MQACAVGSTASDTGAQRGREIDWAAWAGGWPHQTGLCWGWGAVLTLGGTAEGWHRFRMSGEASWHHWLLPTMQHCGCDLTLCWVGSLNHGGTVAETKRQATHCRGRMVLAQSVMLIMAPPQLTLRAVICCCSSTCTLCASASSSVMCCCFSPASASH